MSAKKEKPSGIPPPDGLHNFIVQSSMTTIKKIADCARQTWATGRFSVNPYAGMGKRGNRLKRACDSIQAGAEYTMDNAGNPPDSGIFSRLEFKAGLTFQGSNGLWRDGANRKAARMALSMYSTSRHQLRRLNNGALVLQSHNGAEAMTTPTTPKTGNPSPQARQQAIEAALSAALFHIRQPHAPAALHAATGRAIRAASLLKQACAEIQNGSAA